MGKSKLYILWTTDNLITSEKMVLMYAQNGILRQWWDEINVVIWGASAKLVAETPIIQEKVKMAIHTGVKFLACKGCTDQLNVSDELTALGIEVVYWGGGLSEVLQNGEKLITI